jgi:hypothetical protein
LNRELLKLVMHTLLKDSSGSGTDHRLTQPDLLEFKVQQDSLELAASQEQLDLLVQQV